MFSKFLSFLSILSLGFSVYSSNIIGNDYINGLNITDNQGNNITIDYLKVYEGNTRFGNGVNPYYHSFSHNDCIYKCSVNESCLGIYFGEMENISDIISEMNGSGLDDNNDMSEMCCLFSNLGNAFTNDYSGYSYIKTSHYVGINSTLNNYSYSIRGYVNDYYDYDLNFDNSIVYLDLNHNGVLDENEPNQTVRHNTEFNFNGLQPGNYLVRQITDNGCAQLYPGLNGPYYNYYYYEDFEEFIPSGDGYVDAVQSYFHEGHHTFSVPHGGYVGSNESIDNRNFSFILGNNNETYLSLYPGYNITLVFIDETIISYNDSADVDNLFFDIEGDSSTEAHISISQDGVSYYNLSILSSENTSFNTANVKNITTPIAYVRLHFFGENQDVPLNIKRVYGSVDSIYRPENGFFIHIPIENNYYLYFFNNCNFGTFCYTYCNYKTVDFDSYEACLYGCDLYRNFETCFCDRFDNNTPSELALYFGDENNFNYDSCNMGCEYNMHKNVFPHFDVLVNTSNDGDIIDSFYDCGNNCVDTLSYNCYNNKLCAGFSISRNQSGNTYSGLKSNLNNNTFLFLKSDFSPPTTFPTTFPTTLPTTIASTMASTSSNTLPSTSPTTLPSTTVSTSATTTVSTTATTFAITSTSNINNNANTNNLNNGNTNNNYSGSNKTKDVLLYVLLTVFIISLIVIVLAFIKLRYYSKYINLVNVERNERIDDERNIYSYDNPLYSNTMRASTLVDNDDPYNQELVQNDDNHYVNEFNENIKNVENDNRILNKNENINEYNEVYDHLNNEESNV